MNKIPFNKIHNFIVYEIIDEMRELYTTCNLEDFVYTFKVSKDKEEIDKLETEFLSWIDRKINNTGPLLNILDGDIFSNSEVAREFNNQRNTPEFLEHLSSMVKEKQWSGEKGNLRKEEHSKKFKEINPSRKHYFLRCSA